ncbi:G-type lectin S-receptor-like serine/threonine-protein kinase LECRK1 isoform X2 [Papaver somniferum]|uniref:G-type lectin S-receptor-like serine/threonine-protein kinase LECRK1 isoform X2 n=1 Tax=Papaver somniferum TaxID=3469 RepID=UPI000E6F4702|nr:G-type lectin S-receptor-like serine/threonine-protein kinase LECRK1 isoform X2 [Papaver somniferum]
MKQNKQVMMILSLSLLLLAPLLVVESSSLTKDNITRGSNLSLNDPSPYWLSPSGNLAFGFYQWSPGQYVVGIWFVKSPRQTQVWTANHNDLPLRKPSSIHFTDEGKLMLRRMPDNKEKPLVPDIQEPVSYAEMHDDGNFVLHGS